MALTDICSIFVSDFKNKTMSVQPTKENTLYLPIKQIYFDEILSGKKKKEYREIKETTYQKYLEMWRENGESGLVYDDEKITEAEFDKYPNDPLIYNGGVYPYYPIEYKYLELAVGYAKDRDVMLVEVTDITFEPMKDKNGKIARLSYSDTDGFTQTPDGELCIWQVVYHLGKVEETDLKKDR